MIELQNALFVLREEFPDSPLRQNVFDVMCSYRRALKTTSDAKNRSWPDSDRLPSQRPWLKIAASAASALPAMQRVDQGKISRTRSLAIA
jgi:hypothetical protein